jgi:plastocyanin/cell division septation protein DedD
MKRLNAGLPFTLSLVTLFAMVFLSQAESRDKHLNTQQKKTAAPGIQIMDQFGRPAVSTVPSGTGQVFDVAVGKGGDVFVPDSVNISVGDTVRWTWAESGHSVSSGPPCLVDSQFCSPDDTNCIAGVLSNIGTVYEHTFAEPGVYSYFCHAHCIIGMTGVVNVSGGCTPAGWSAGEDMPTVLVRAAGVHFQADGNFYTMGGRISDNPGDDFQHALQYNPSSNTWTQMASTFPDNQMNNMACGVLTVSGAPLIYCVGGSAAGASTAAARVFTYDPTTDTPALLGSDDWPGDAAGTILPGGFTVANNKLYIMGGFNINVASTNEIWEFDPNAAAGSRWTQKTNAPEGIMYAPTCTINGIIYVGGASDFQGGTVVDTTNSFSFDPVANTIGTITAIPRATGETRGLNFNGQMYVMGGGRVAPNPSNEVDIYDPGTNAWTTGAPFVNARRNFPTDTDGTTRIVLSGGYDIDGITPLMSTEVFCQGGGTPTPTPTATPTATATATPTPTATATPTPTTPTPTPTVTVTPTPSGTPTPPPTPTPRATPRPRPTPHPRPTPP